MATKKTVYPLQRGSACLCCRKRKMKCDGVRPTCSQCLKTRRGNECEYDDKKQKSRTQALKEKLAMLEDRIRELESDPALPSPYSGTVVMPSVTPPSSTASPISVCSDSPLPLAGSAGLTYPSFDSAFPDPPLDSSPWLSMPSSSIGSPYNCFSDVTSEALGLGVASSKAFQGQDGLFDSPVDGYFDFLGSPMSPMSGGYFSSPQWSDDELPYQNKQMLLEIFLSHRQQCGFDASVAKFQSPSTMSPHQQPHPALMNSLYLLACHFARSPWVSELEPFFFTRALQDITVALDHSDRLVDIVQASCLLAVYLFSNGRVLEGYCHSFSATRLAVGLGLHQIRGWDVMQSREDEYQYDEPTAIPIPPPQDAQELQDRIATFWQVFKVDRCWSAAHGLPTALSDEDSPHSRIRTPWPQPMEGVSVVQLSDATPVRSLYERKVAKCETPSFVPALRAKASALYERTFRLAAVPSTSRSNLYWDEHHAVSTAVEAFAAALPPFSGRNSWQGQRSSVDVDLLTVHTMTHVSVIYLQKDLVDKSPGARDKFFQAGSAVTSLIRQLSNSDYEFLDPILSACWLFVARMYLFVLGHATKNSKEFDCSASLTETELEVLIGAMGELSTVFPLAGEHAHKVERELIKARTP